MDERITILSTENDLSDLIEVCLMSTYNCIGCPWALPIECGALWKVYHGQLIHFGQNIGGAEPPHKKKIGGGGGAPPRAPPPPPARTPMHNDTNTDQLQLGNDTRVWTVDEEMSLS